MRKPLLEEYKLIDPNYNYSGNSLDVFARNTRNDKPKSGYKNSILSTGIGTKFEQYRDVYLSPQISLSYDDLTVESTASESLKKQKGSFTDLSFDYGISLDKRDRVMLQQMDTIHLSIKGFLFMQIHPI